jgi:hypothetical protein
VLGGKSVLYSDSLDIKAALDYDFEQEQQFDYSALDMRSSVKNIVKFISGIWQIHAFGEGNTRTTAVFAIKYLRSFGFDIDNKPFEKHSWYFRNALVRAHYNDLPSGITATDQYLMLFFWRCVAFFGKSREVRHKGACDRLARFGLWDGLDPDRHVQGASVAAIRQCVQGQGHFTADARQSL